LVVVLIPVLILAFLGALLSWELSSWEHLSPWSFPLFGEFLRGIHLFSDEFFAEPISTRSMVLLGELLRSRLCEGQATKTANFDRRTTILIVAYYLVDGSELL
jgi:hypothetical protein